MDKKILIIGRSGSGKDTVSQHLTQVYGLKQLLSTTTRPMRYPDEDTHIFVSEDEANKMTERVAETNIDGYQYFATEQQLINSDIYIIDPRGLGDVCRNAPDTDICVIYVYANRDVRKQRAILRAADQKKAEMVFDSRDASENAQFEELEDMLFNLDISEFNKKYPSVSVVSVINNNAGDINKVYEDASKIYRLLTTHKLRKSNPYNPMYYEF